MSARITATALKDTARFFEEFPALAEEAAMLAINDTVQREGLTLLKRTMRQEVSFPSGYLEGDRLKPTRFASRGRLEAVITARDRPTSLARFAQGQTPANTRGQGVRVRVGPGQAKLMKRAFLVKLNNGQSTGLAVRLSPGERLRKTQRGVLLDAAKNVWLLYGPSVDQVLRGVADDRSDEIINIIDEKFTRQFRRLARGS